MNRLPRLSARPFCGIYFFLFAVSIAATSHCIAENIQPTQETGRPDAKTGGYSDVIETSIDAHAIYDPFEGFNRGVFWFNDKLDVYFLEPVASAYNTVVPDRAQKGVSNFFSNLRFPVNLVSDVAQLDFSKAGTDTVRFLVNSTAGIGGLLDVAEEIGLKKNYQDFGMALGHWGVESGPYLVLPIMGPSSVRDGLGRIVDTVAHPLFYLNYVEMPNRDRNVISFTARGLDVVQSRADLLEAIETGKEASFDYYSFVRSSYTQRRKAMVQGAAGFEDEEMPPGADKPQE